MSVYADVALPLPLYKTFLYLIPGEWAAQAAPGCRVEVPFRGRTRLGYIIRIRRSVPQLKFTCKPVSKLIDAKPLFKPEYLSFILKLSQTFYSPSGELLHASFPAGFKVKEKTRLFLTQAGRKILEGKKADRAQLQAMQMLAERSYSKNYFIGKAGKNGRAVVDALLKKKWISLEKKFESKAEKAPPKRPSSFQMEMAFSGRITSDEMHAVSRALETPGFLPFLVQASQDEREAAYFALIRKCLSLSKTVLFLQPEIDLSHRFQEKWEKRLGENMIILHSRVSEAEKKRIWGRIQNSLTRVVAGPRSALLTPLPDLGLIIVDEEQDDLYYQEESPVYDARKGTWLRAQEENAVLVYGSENPRVEDVVKAREEKFLIAIRNKEGKKPAQVNVVAHQPEKSLLHKNTQDFIKRAVRGNKQVLVFSNRRGYAAFVFCRRCRYIPRCENCDIPLMVSRTDGRMVCRYCRFSKPALRDCPRCGSRMIRGKGWGVETVAEELKKLLPQNTVEGFYSDAFRKPEDKESCLKKYRSGDIDVLVGTRMLARHIQPYSSPLVVVLFPETLLSLPDFRAGQRTFDYLCGLKKLAGGAADTRFVIQTDYPQHHAVAAAARGDYSLFYEEEINYRRLLNYPPFTIMAEVIFQDRSPRAAARYARDFSRRAANLSSEAEILGPSKAPLARLRGKHRVQLLIKSRRRQILDKIFTANLTDAHTRASVKIYE